MDRTTAAKAIKTAFGAFIAASALLIAYTVFSTADSADFTPSAFLYLLGRVSGLVGFVLLSSLIISGDSARYFDRYFGLDKIIKFHRWYSLVVAVFVIFHPVFIILSYWDLFDYIIPRASAIPLSLGILGFYAYLTVEISSRLAKMISYKSWQYLHILTYVLFFFTLYHALFQGSDTMKPQILVLFFLLSTAILIGIAYRTSYKLRQRAYKHVVRGVKWETKDTFTLELESSRNEAFIPGQFYFLRIENKNLHARHPFSVTSVPSGKSLDFTIKLKGPFTKAASELKPGDEVKLEGPFGIFTLEDGHDDAVFLAFGVGITPFMSIIRDASLSGAKRKFILFYASRSPEDIIFREKLASIKGDWLKQVILVSSGATAENGYLSGRLEAGLIKKHAGDIEHTDFYLCGSEEVKAFMKKTLGELGARPHRIKNEEFFW